MTGREVSRGPERSACCSAVLRRIANEVLHPDYGCYGFVPGGDGKCRERVVDWCPVCGHTTEVPSPAESPQP